MSGNETSWRHGRTRWETVQTTTHSLDSKEVQNDLQWFKCVLQTSYGPCGKALVFQPSSGGHVTVTSRSEKIFQLLRTDNPVLRILQQPLQLHVQKYGDAGLFAGLLAVNLVLSGMELGLPRHKVAMVTSHALSMVVDYLKSGKCLCCNALRLSSAGHMMCLLRSFFSSKNAVCHLGNSELDHVASLILQGFLKVVPTSSVSSQTFSAQERLHIHTVLGKTATHSRLYDGLLVESSEQLSLREEVGRMSGGREEEEEEEERGRKLEIRRNQEGLIITAVFNISLAGDIEDHPSELTLVTSSANLGMATGKQGVKGMLMVGQIMRLMERLVEEEGVGFVGCQKCIHPLIKDYLKEKGVVVAERISLFHIDSVRDVTGAQLVSSLSLHGRLGDGLGRLRDIRSVSIGEKRYLVLESDAAHCSLMLCCKTEAFADELKPLCSSAVSVLEHSLHQPFVLYGGGCTETVLCHYLLEKAEEVTESTLCELQCNKKTYACVVRNVAKAFASIASPKGHAWNCSEIVLTDTAFHHKWVFPSHEHIQGADSAHANGERSGYVLRFAKPSKTCCCGSLRLSRLSSLGCGWNSLHDLQGGFSAIPEALLECLKARQNRSPSTTNGFGENRWENGSTLDLHRPELVGTSVCDAFLPRVKAVELSNDISCAVLRIAYIVCCQT